MYKKILSDVSWLKTIMNIDNNNNDDTGTVRNKNARIV